MILGKYSLQGSDRGILSAFFPDRVWLEEPLGPFVIPKKVLIFSKRDLDFYPEKDCILITPSAPLKLDTKPGAMAYLEATHPKLSANVKSRLALLEDSEFWQEVKIFLRIGSFSSTPESNESVFSIFVNLFEPLHIVYPIYRKSNTHHMVVFSSLLTMMLKTQMDNMSIVSAGYRKALLENKKYFTFYKKMALEFLSSDMEEPDFLSFLASLNLAKR